MTSQTPSYAQVVQKIELFSSFFDRLLASSPNYHQHIQTLAKFKTTLYRDAKSPKTLDSHIDELFGSKIQTPDTSSIKSQPNSNSESKPSHQLSVDLKSEPNSMTSLTETLQMLKENPSPTETTVFALDYRQSINDLVTIFQLLSKLRATEHVDINSLFLMAGDYSHVRMFEHPQHSTFLALSFAFYEKLLLRDLKPGSSVIVDSRLKKIIASEAEKLNPKKTPKSAYRELVLCLQDIFDGRNSGNTISLFNLITSNQEVYGASVLLFREIVHNLVSSTSFSLQSMNESSPSNEQLFQSICSIMQNSIRFMLLDTVKLTKKDLNSPETQAQSGDHTPRNRNNNEITTILFDKRSNQAYLLYKSHGSKNSPTAKRTNLNTANSPSKKGFTIVPVQATLPTPSFEVEKRRMTLIPSYQTTNPHDPQLFNLITPSRSDKTNKPRSLHEINENEAISVGLSAKGRDAAPVRHTGEGQPYNLNVIPPGSISGSMNLGQPESLVGLSSYNPTLASPNVSIISKTFNEDNLGLLRPPNLGGAVSSNSILNVGQFLPGNPSLLGAKHDSILSNVGNLLGDISTTSENYASLTELKEKSRSNPVPGSVRGVATSYDDLNAPSIQRRFSLKKVPNFIRQSFEHANKDVQGHEAEFNKISETYLKTEFAKPDKKPSPNQMNSLLQRYKTILAKKGENPTSSHMQSGMRMDH